MGIQAGAGWGKQKTPFRQRGTGLSILEKLVQRCPAGQIIEIIMKPVPGIGLGNTFRTSALVNTGVTMRATLSNDSGGPQERV